MPILSSFPTVSLLLFYVSVSRVQSCHAMKSSKIKNDSAEEELPFCPNPRQIKIYSFTQAAASRNCYEKGLLFVEIHPSIFEQRCYMATKGVMDILPDVPFYIYIANMSAKAVCQTKCLMVASATNALPHIIHAQSDESDMPDEPKLDNTIHATRAWVRTNNVSLETRMKTPHFRKSEAPKVSSI